MLNFILGIITSTVTNFIVLFLINTLAKYKESVSQISYTLIYYVNVYTNKGLKKELHNEAGNALRECMSRFESSYLSLPVRPFLSKIQMIPSFKEFNEVKSSLTYLSNATIGAQNIDADPDVFFNLEQILKNEDTIRKILKIQNKN